MAGARAQIKGMKLDADFQNVIFQDVVVVSNAQTVPLPVTDRKGDVTVKLDRGDGLCGLSDPGAGVSVCTRGGRGILRTALSTYVGGKVWWPARDVCTDKASESPNSASRLLRARLSISAGRVAARRQRASVAVRLAHTPRIRRQGRVLTVQQVYGRVSVQCSVSALAQDRHALSRGPSSRT